MKKITLLIVLLTTAFSFGQNLLTNGDFESTETGSMPAPWAGYANQVVVDAISGSQAGNNNNGDSSTLQVFTVTPGETYNATFDYRWVSGSGGYALTANIKDGATGGSSLGTFICSTTPDVWHTDGLINFTVPTGVTQARIIFWKPNGNRPFRMDNVSVTIDATASIEDLQKFNFSYYPNPAKDNLRLSSAKPIENVQLYNILGQQVLNKDVNESKPNINVSNLSKGVYIMKVKIEDAVGSFKFIKE